MVSDSADTRMRRVTRQMILEELVMKKSYGVNELRRMYLDFFESKGTSCHEELFISTTQ